MVPILLEFGPVRLYSYGLLVALGFLVAVTLASRSARSVGLDPAQIQACGLVTLIAGILGARLAYVLLNWGLFRSNPLEILRLDHGGLVFYGGLAAGVLAGVAFLRAKGLPVLRLADLLTPPFILAHAIGRIGCFLNGCCYGKPASVPWAVAFPFDGIPRHPTQLYETVFLIVLFFVLNRQSSISATMQGGSASGGVHPPSRAPGTLLLTYGLAYGTWRFGIEFLRGDNPIVAWGLTVFQLASLPLLLGSGLGLWLLKKRS